MNDHIVSTKILVSGIRRPEEVSQALQVLYDEFADLGLGQAAFEVHDNGPAELWVKHLDSVTVDVARISVALKRAGDFHIVN